MTWSLETIYGVPIADVPEPLQAALRARFEREWTGDPKTFIPSPLLDELMRLCCQWQAQRRYRRPGDLR